MLLRRAGLFPHPSRKTNFVSLVSIIQDWHIACVLSRVRRSNIVGNHVMTELRIAIIGFGRIAQRQHVAAIGRRVSTLCKGEEGLDQQLALYHGYYNFCLPHGSVRQPLPQPVPTNGTGSAKQWRPCTPAMAAGLTAHVWTLKEVLL